MLDGNTPPASNQPELFSELVKVNQEIYKKNLELLVRNRTLLALREIYDVINHSLGIQNTAQNLIEKIVNSLDFQIGIIALFDDQKILRSYGIHSKNQNTELVNKLKEFQLAQTDQPNICTEVCGSMTMKKVDSWSSFLNGAFDEQTINTIQHGSNIKSFFAYPILFGGNCLGVLLLGIDKTTQELNETDEQILNEIMGIVGIGINQARNYTNLEDALRTERDMLDILGHELRTPLTIAKNAVILIDTQNKQNKLDQNTLNSFIEKAVENLRRESKLVETILTSTKIDSNNLRLTPEPVNIVESINNSLLAFAGQAQDKGLQLIQELPEQATAFVDKVRVEEVIDNIISNAIKYTFKGFVKISVYEENNQIIFAVSDSGEGISEEDLKHLGQKFYRANNYMTRDINNNHMQVIRPGGTGLGLYVIFNLIKKMNGKIDVTSKVGEGSTFKVSFPKYTNQPVLEVAPQGKMIDKIKQRQLELMQQNKQSNAAPVSSTPADLNSINQSPVNSTLQ